MESNSECRISALARNARDAGSIHALGVIFPIFITTMVKVYHLFTCSYKLVDRQYMLGTSGSSSAVGNVVQTDPVLLSTHMSVHGARERGSVAMVTVMSLMEIRNIVLEEELN